MRPQLIAAAEIDRVETWTKYNKDMCTSCMSTCCTMPLEVRIADLIRLGVVDEFERGERQNGSSPPRAARTGGKKDR